MTTDIILYMILPVSLLFLLIGLVIGWVAREYMMNYREVPRPHPEMFDVNENTRIIDTPGIKGFGLVDFKKEELGMYFPEMMALLDQCKFHNCKHINEPGCEVLNQLKQGNLSISRYQSYLSMYQDDPENNYRQNMYS